MLNWTDIHSDFTPELQKEWEEFNLAYEQAEEWIEKGGLLPIDAGFARYLLIVGYGAEELSDESINLDQLRRSYESGEFFIERKRKSKEDWKKIHFEFTPELIQLWQSLGFAYEQTQEWINIGLSPNEAYFCQWLDRVVGVTVEEVLNCCNDIQELKNQFTIYQTQAQIVQANYGK